MKIKILQLLFKIFNYCRDNKISQLIQPDIRELYQRIGYAFKNEELLIMALKHRSYIAQAGEQRIQSNERLEFLGDSILSMVISRHLYKKLPDESEGNLSKLKSIIVSGENLSRVAIRFGLGEYMIISDAEAKTGGRNKSSLLEDCFEALVGAIYLDGGLIRAESFIKKSLLQDSFEDLANLSSNRNYKSDLLELVQSYGLKPPTYKVINEEGPEHQKTFTVMVIVQNLEISQGSSLSKKKAEQEASAKALEILQNSPDLLIELKKG